jgi:hypothetical protein
MPNTITTMEMAAITGARPTTLRTALARAKRVAQVDNHFEYDRQSDKEEVIRYYEARLAEHQAKLAWYADIVRKAREI